MLGIILAAVSAAVCLTIGLFLFATALNFVIGIAAFVIR